MSQIAALAVFVTAFCLLVYFVRHEWRAFRAGREHASPEWKSDMARLREQRRRRIAARRKR